MHISDGTKKNTRDIVSLLVSYKDAQQTGTEGTANCIGGDVFIFFFNNPLLLFWNREHS